MTEIKRELKRQRRWRTIVLILWIAILAGYIMSTNSPDWHEKQFPNSINSTYWVTSIEEGKMTMVKNLSPEEAAKIEATNDHHRSIAPFLERDPLKAATEAYGFRQGEAHLITEVFDPSQNSGGPTGTYVLNPSGGYWID